MVRPVLLLVLAMVASIAFATAATSAADPVVVCIDPGHGGADPGALNGDLREADINLDVSLALEGLLQGDSRAVVMTRRDDVSLSNRARYTYCNDQGADLFVSVHTNSSTDPSVDGSLAIYFHNDDKALAQAIQTEVYAGLAATAPKGVAFTDFGLKKDALGVILKTDMPGAVIEPLFMSNGDEAALLGTEIAACGDSLADCRRGQIALAIKAGINAYLEQSPPGDGGGDSGDGGGGPKCGTPPCGKGR